MSKVKLSAKWQLDAALLSRPVDLTALVTMSKSTPDKFTEDDTLHRLVKLLLNEKNKVKSDKDTKLDVLTILANVAGAGSAGNALARVALSNVSEWFDEYISTEESDPSQEPELHKAMVLLLARCWEYKLKTEDVLELCQGDRRIALCTVVGLLEDGETYSTELKQRQRPEAGKMAQWEHELVCQRYEKPLLMQICRLLRGFTHPGTYFEASDGEIAIYSIERFGAEMDTLLEITLRSRLVEKLSVALYDCLFEVEEALLERQASGEDDGDETYVAVLEESDHMAVVCVHAFLQNLYFYASENNEEFRTHMLVETLLIPRLVLPYLDRCVLHATILNSRAEAYADVLEGDRIAEMALHNPQLVKGIAASLRTLIIASFRAPATQFVVSLLRRLNPTGQMLRAAAFCRHHEYIFALLCLLNVNMGALDLSRVAGGEGSPGGDGQDSGDEGQDGDSSSSYNAHALLHELASVYASMDAPTQGRVYKRVMSSGALPVSRDTPSYVAVMSVLHGGAAWSQLEYVTGRGCKEDEEEDNSFHDTRAEAKSAHASRMASLPRVATSDSPPSSFGAGDKLSSSSSSSAGGSGSSSNGQAQEKQSSSSSGGGDESKGGGGGRGRGRDEPVGGNTPPRRADAKSTSVAAAARAEQKDRAPGYRLLGDLPGLGRDKDKHMADVKVALSLELPGEGRVLSKPTQGATPAVAAPKYVDDGIPREYKCAINGHVMKEPVRCASSGLVFEKATIELWLATRGCMCPITNTPLDKDGLEPADDLKNRIKRFHITQMSKHAADGDDVYDF